LVVGLVVVRFATHEMSGIIPEEIAGEVREPTKRRAKLRSDEIAAAFVAMQFPE
jgi:hypothetical protein